MKKLLIFALLMVGVSTTSFATDSNDVERVVINNNNFVLYEGAAAYDFSGASMKGFKRCLSLTNGQQRRFEETYCDFVEMMKYAYKCYERDIIVKNVVKKNLTEMRRFLNDAQFADYVKILDITLQHRGIEYQF